MTSTSEENMRSNKNKFLREKLEVAKPIPHSLKMRLLSLKRMRFWTSKTKMIWMSILTAVSKNPNSVDLLKEEKIVENYQIKIEEIIK